MSEAYKQIAEGLKLMAAGYEALASLGSAADTDSKKPKKTNTKPPVAETQVEETASTTENEEPSFDREKVLAEIRAVLSPKCKEGKTELCQALLRDYGVPNLSNIPDDKLMEFKSRAEVL